MSDQTATRLHGHPLVTGFYEKRTGSVQYVVADPETKLCAIIRRHFASQPHLP